MKKTQLQAQTRNALGSQAKNLRKKMQIPAILYGKGIKNVNLTLESKSLENLLIKFGANALINLSINQQKPILVFLQDIQRDPINSKIIHCDLWKIDPKKPIKTDIPIKAVGISPAIEEHQGILLQAKNNLNISALPDNLMAEIKVDISSLKTFEDKIQIKDIVTDNEIEVLDNPEETVFSVQEPRSEEELEEKPEENVERVEVEEKGKEEKIEKDDEAKDPTKETEKETPPDKTGQEPNKEK